MIKIHASKLFYRNEMTNTITNPYIIIYTD